MKKLMTHTVLKVGCTACVPKGYGEIIKVRETKLYWIAERGYKYSKKWSGLGVGTWSNYRILPKTLKPLNPKEEKDK